ncbi:hypothetical protein B0H14DRAFT_2629017 [Mycena olivaceomarginata]|nr:hypothetical protein B0H14DRAFT_2629017 [Mycena olivaceomarginata]
MGSWVYTNYPFHQLINISSAVNFSLLDNIFIIQGSSFKVLFVDNSAIMGLDCAAREAVIFATTLSLRSHFGHFLEPFWWPVAEKHRLYDCVCLSLLMSEMAGTRLRTASYFPFWWPVAERHWLYNCFWWPVAEKHWLYDCVCLSLSHVRNGWYPAQNCQPFFLSGGQWLKSTGFAIVSASVFPMTEMADTLNCLLFSSLNHFSPLNLWGGLNHLQHWQCGGLILSHPVAHQLMPQLSLVQSIIILGLGICHQVFKPSSKAKIQFYSIEGKNHSQCHKMYYSSPSQNLSQIG